MNRYEPCYEDSDLCKFGKHRDEPLEDVPASYLHWYAHNVASDRKLMNYIRNSLSALKEEASDLIWTCFK